MRSIKIQHSTSRKTSSLKPQGWLFSRITRLAAPTRPAIASRRRKLRAKAGHASCAIGSCAILLLGGFQLLQAAQPTTNAPVSSQTDFSSFRIISDRNIFNMRRTASSRYVPPGGSFTGRSRTRSESFALVGTMHYDKGPFAFFDGSRSDYRKVLKPDDTIGGWKVAEILPSAVKLTSSTNEIELPVGMQLRRENENSDWVKSERPESAEPTGGAASSSHLSFQSAASTPPPDSTGDFQNGGPDGGPPALDPNAIQAFFNGDPSQNGGPFSDTNAPPATAPATDGVTDPVILRMMQRRAQERGD